MVRRRAKMILPTLWTVAKLSDIMFDVAFAL